MDTQSRSRLSPGNTSRASLTSDEDTNQKSQEISLAHTAGRGWATSSQAVHPAKDPSRGKQLRSHLRRRTPPHALLRDESHALS